MLWDSEPKTRSMAFAKAGRSPLATACRPRDARARSAPRVRHRSISACRQSSRSRGRTRASTSRASASIAPSELRSASEPNDQGSTTGPVGWPPEESAGGGASQRRASGGSEGRMPSYGIATLKMNPLLRVVAKPMSLLAFRFVRARSRGEPTATRGVRQGAPPERSTRASGGTVARIARPGDGPAPSFGVQRQPHSQRFRTTVASWRLTRPPLRPSRELSLRSRRRALIQRAYPRTPWPGTPRTVSGTRPRTPAGIASRSN